LIGKASKARTRQAGEPTLRNSFRPGNQHAGPDIGWVLIGTSKSTLPQSEPRSFGVPGPGGSPAYPQTHSPTDPTHRPTDPKDPPHRRFPRSPGAPGAHPQTHRPTRGLQMWGPKTDPPRVIKSSPPSLPGALRFAPPGEKPKYMSLGVQGKLRATTLLLRQALGQLEIRF
jgi:hypothetical protein